MRPRSLVLALEPAALAFVLACPLAMLALSRDGLALLRVVLTVAVPGALLYGLYRLALRGRPRPGRRPALRSPPLPPAPREIRAAFFRVTRGEAVLLHGTLDDVVAAARAGRLRASDVVTGAGVQAAPADLADLAPHVPSTWEARALKLYAVYLLGAAGAGAAGVTMLLLGRLLGNPAPDVAFAVLAFALALLPLPSLRREWRRLADGRARGLVPESEAALRAEAEGLRRARDGAGLGAALAGPTPATRAVLALVVAVSVAAMLLPPEALQLRLAKDNDAIRGGEVWRLLTAGLVHGGALHLLMNAWVLSDLGRVVERLLGAGRMLAVLWGGVIAGSLASFVVNPQRSVGVSGGLFALVGALLAVGLRHRRALPPAARGMLVRGPVEVIVLNVALGFALPFIDNAAHMGGLAGGVLLGLGARLRPEVAAALRGRPGAPPPGAGGP